MWEETRDYGRSRFGVFTSRRISWSAILAGIAAAFAVAILLGLLGTGLGAGSINPLKESNPFEGLGVGALIWMIITGFIAFFIAGCIAAYGSRASTRTDALAHGFLTWSVATVLGLWIVTGAAGSVLSGSAGLVAGGTEMAAKSTELTGKIREELEKRGVSTESIRQQAESPETRARVEQNARETGQSIAQGVSKAALGGFAMLLLNMFASLLGAVSGVQRYPGETTVATERVA